MKHLLLAAIAALTIALTPAVAVTASADSGNYSTDDGPSCSWYGYGNSITLDCSGHSRRAGAYVSYSCQIDTFGTSYSYSCRDRQGNRWSGSR